MAEETPGLLYSLLAALDRGSAQQGRVGRKRSGEGMTRRFQTHR